MDELLNDMTESSENSSKINLDISNDSENSIESSNSDGKESSSLMILNK